MHIFLVAFRAEGNTQKQNAPSSFEATTREWRVAHFLNLIKFTEQELYLLVTDNKKKYLAIDTSWLLEKLPCR